MKTQIIDNILTSKFAIGDNLNEGYPVTITTTKEEKVTLKSDWNHGNIRYTYSFRSEKHTFWTLDGLLLAVNKRFKAIKIEY